MTMMFRRLGTAGLLAALPGLAAAQSMSFGQVDADGNGTLGPSELSAAFGEEAAARVLANQDLNGDGMLSRAEAVARPTAASAGDPGSAGSTDSSDASADDGPPVSDQDAAGDDGDGAGQAFGDDDNGN